MNDSFYPYPHQNFVCNHCQEQFTQQTLYSVVPQLEKVPYQATYCWTCATLLIKNQPSMPKLIKIKPKSKKKTPKKTTALKVTLTPKPTKTKSSPTDYYHCLLNYSQQGFYDSEAGKKLKIHACCKKCKLLAPSLNNQRDKELVKLITAYQQVGDSLKKLLKPLT